MQANSTQRPYRTSIVVALGSFIGCALFSLFYFYKDRQLDEASAALADEIQDTQIRCAAEAPSAPRESECERMPDLRVRLYRDRAVQQAYRDKAHTWLGLALALATLSLAGGKWWHWVVTRRIRPKTKPRARKK